MIQELEQLLTVDEVASLLKVKPYTIRGWINQGKLKAIKLEGKAGWRIRQRDLQEFLDQRLKKVAA